MIIGLTSPLDKFDDSKKIQQKNFLKLAFVIDC